MIGNLNGNGLNAVPLDGGLAAFLFTTSAVIVEGANAAVAEADVLVTSGAFNHTQSPDTSSASAVSLGLRAHARGGSITRH